MKTIVKSRAELQRLKDRANRRAIRFVKLDFEPGEPSIERAERKMNRLLRSCGCETGAIFVALGLAYFLWRWLAMSQRPTIGSLITLLALALTGKITGLIYAEWQVRKTIAQFNEN